MRTFISSEQTSDDFVHINSCGRQHFCGINAGSARPLGRIDYHILYISKGVCYVTLDGKEEAADEGSVVLFLPKEPLLYTFHADKESVSYYIHYSGVFCDSLLRSLDLYDRKIIHLSRDSVIESLFAKLIGEFSIKKPFYEQSCQGIFINLLSSIARKNRSAATNGLRNRNKLMFDICGIMHERYAENLSIAQYAEMANLSPGRFMHIFTDMTGVSPKQYLLRIKLERAIELLSDTNLSIAQIAELVGISDNNYFSRVFKKHTGHSPGFYR